MTPVPASPVKCLHAGSLFIHERRAAGPDDAGSRDEVVSVCPRCGTLTVTGYNDDGYFKVQFVLTTQNQLDAAAQYLWRIEGRSPGRDLQLGQPIDEALLAELAALRAIADVAADTITTIDEWPQATTTKAFRDACWRLMRTLQRHGYGTRPWRDLEWRGSIIAALERAGLGIGADDEVHVRLATDQPWQPASGPQITPEIST